MNILNTLENQHRLKLRNKEDIFNIYQLLHVLEVMKVSYSGTNNKFHF